MLEGTVFFETSKAPVLTELTKKCKVIENVWLFGGRGHGAFELGRLEEASL